MSRSVLVVGGGAAGFFGAIAAAENGARVTLCEKSHHFLAKVRISGGGRCNVTHSCFQPREFSTRYPRGGRALIGPFQKFGATETVEWFRARGVGLKTEADGRMFPLTDRSDTIIDCLMTAAQKAGVELLSGCGVDAIDKCGTGFRVNLSNGQHTTYNGVLLALGGCRSEALARLPVDLGHTIEKPVPSLFTFHIDLPWLHGLAGVSVKEAAVHIPGTKLKERGPVLITHWGLSGPAILRLSAWGARELHGFDYRFPMVINWLPKLSREEIAAKFLAFRQSQGARLVANTPIDPLTSRLWEQLIAAAGIGSEDRWATLSRDKQDALLRQLSETRFEVGGKSLNKDEFVTCGGVRLKEVDFKTMESRITPGLHFAGEVLDIDGITGGFNFQAAWTTGWIAGHSLAGTPV